MGASLRRRGRPYKIPVVHSPLGMGSIARIQELQRAQRGSGPRLSECLCGSDLDRSARRWYLKAPAICGAGTMLIGILANWLALVWWFSPPTGEEYVLRLPGNPCP